MDWMKITVEVIGWSGALMLLGGYGLLTAGKIAANSRMYQGLNVIGALCFIINSGYNGAIPSATVNVIWMAIGLASFWQLAKNLPESPRP